MIHRAVNLSCWAWLGILAVILARTALADIPATQPTTEPTTAPTPRVIALVNDLTSDQFSVRQKAQADLQQMGPAVVPQLRELLSGPISIEARTRIEAAIKRIGEVREFGPSVITIHCTDAPLEGVMEDFAHQAGADLGVHRAEIRGYLQSHKITLNLDHADFWTALQAVEDASGLHRRPDTDGELILDNNPGFWGGQMGDLSFAKIVGPCLIVPMNVSSNMQYNANYTYNLSLQLSVMVEPKLHIVGSFQPNWLRECVDEKGQSLVRPEPNQGFFYNNGPQQWIKTINANLTPAADMGMKIARLKGELDFEVQTKSEVIIIDNIQSAHNVSRHVAGNTFTVQQFHSEGTQYVLDLQVAGPLALPNSQFMQYSMNGLFRLLDDNDQSLQQMGGSQNMDGRGEITLNLRYMANVGWRPPNAPPVGTPRKLEFEITTETRPMSEPFEFDDLPLRPPQKAVP